MIIQLCDKEIQVLNDLSSASGKVYLKLKELRWAYNIETFYRSTRDLGRDCSLNPRTIMKALKDIKKSGLIDITKSKTKKTNRFFLNYF